MDEYRSIIRKIESQLHFNEVRRSAGLPSKGHAWEQSARFALSRYREELAALERRNPCMK